MSDSDKMISTQMEGAWTYAEACAVIDELKAIGVHAGVTVGGVHATFDLEKHGPSVVRIVKKHKGVFCVQTLMQALTLEAANERYMTRLRQELEDLWNSHD